jgi:hypothetical protein
MRNQAEQWFLRCASGVWTSPGIFCGTLYFKNNYWVKVAVSLSPLISMIRHLRFSVKEAHPCQAALQAASRHLCWCVQALSNNTFDATAVPHFAMDAPVTASRAVWRPIRSNTLRFSTVLRLRAPYSSLKLPGYLRRLLQMNVLLGIVRLTCFNVPLLYMVRYLPILTRPPELGSGVWLSTGKVQ